MKTKITLLALLFLALNISFAQQDEECMLNLTLMNDYVKSKKYDEAYEPWMKVRNKCPKFSYAIYAYGEKILDHKIKNNIRLLILIRDGVKLPSKIIKTTGLKNILEIENLIILERTKDQQNFSE